MKEATYKGHMLYDPIYSIGKSTETEGKLETA